MWNGRGTEPGEGARTGSGPGKSGDGAEGNLSAGLAGEPAGSGCAEGGSGARGSPGIEPVERSAGPDRPTNRAPKRSSSSPGLALRLQQMPREVSDDSQIEDRRVQA